MSTGSNRLQKPIYRPPGYARQAHIASYEGADRQMHPIHYLLPNDFVHRRYLTFSFSQGQLTTFLSF